MEAGQQERRRGASNEVVPRSKKRQRPGPLGSGGGLRGRGTRLSACAMGVWAHRGHRPSSFENWCSKASTTGPKSRASGDWGCCCCCCLPPPSLSAAAGGPAATGLGYRSVWRGSRPALGAEDWSVARGGRREHPERRVEHADAGHAGVLGSPRGSRRAPIRDALVSRALATASVGALAQTGTAALGILQRATNGAFR